MSRLAVAAMSVVTAVAAAGCSSGSGAGASATPPPPTTTPTCASAAPSPTPSSSAAARALGNVPFGLPMPPHLSVVDSRVTTDGIRVIRFTTPTSLRDSVLFIVGQYPKAGYVLGRGDAEATEADAPFIRNGVRGLTRVAAVQPCQTLWLVASVATKKSGGSPLLSPHPTSSVTTPLPFG